MPKKYKANIYPAMSIITSTRAGAIKLNIFKLFQIMCPFGAVFAFVIVMMASTLNELPLHPLFFLTQDYRLSELAWVMIVT